MCTRELGGFFRGGFSGLIAAMGVMFISLQGFEMVSAIAGEIKEPQAHDPEGDLRLAGDLARDLRAVAIPRRDRGRG